jgi:hypothetical protein
VLRIGRATRVRTFSAEYKIQNGTPRFYVEDDDAIESSDQSSTYSDLILDPKHLETLARKDCSKQC